MEFNAASLLAAFAGGLLSFLSPCVFPLIPSYATFITGLTAEELQEAQNPEARRVAWRLGGAFVLGMSLVFVGLGATATALSGWLLESRIWLERIGGVVVALLGLHLLGITPFRFLAREYRLHWTQQPTGWVGALLVGMAFGAGWTPCIGPILGSIMTLAATQETLLEGMTLLGVYSAGLAIPFLAAIVGLGWLMRVSDRLKPWLPWLEKASGMLLLMVAVLLITGSMSDLTALMANWTPEWILERI